MKKQLPMINRLLFLFLILLTFACSNKETDKRLLVPFIESYEQIPDRCSKIILETLKSHGAIDGDINVKGVYGLKIILNDSIYSQDDLLVNQFIGILYEPDTLYLDVFCFDKLQGMVSPTIQIADKKLIINNIIKLSLDLQPLRICSYFDFRRELVESSHTRKNIFRAVAMDTKMYGIWERKINDKKPHHTEFDNGIWNFVRENKIIVTSNLGDTIVNDNFKMEGYDLSFEKSECPYDILSITKKAIVFLDKESYSTVTFYKLK